MPLRYSTIVSLALFALLAQWVYVLAQAETLYKSTMPDGRVI